MAAQVNNVQPFVSCNAYYGYLPINTQQQQQSQPQTLINNDIGMDVDNESCLARVQNNSNNIVQQKQQTHEFFMSVEEDHWRRSQGRKRVFDKDEVANYMPRFKKFRTETMVTNMFSMVQETVSCPKSADWPRCTMNRYYA
ncbi:uncharacterized protein LOC131672905 isoform X2 [Phymastichus coffea]|uniref:uncharacterized protein LOC131672905 isoform X2 n=1 Tax=Phymastichus coffea TaxID=108790 RepID=UPI00273B0ACB|nr:uncharacterized protein LOC131672905 isoform X2 [Phymastichus coffea]